MNERERTQQRYTTTFPLRLSDVCVWGTACCLLCWCSLLFWFSLSLILFLSLSLMRMLYTLDTRLCIALLRARSTDTGFDECVFVCLLACLAMSVHMRRYISMYEHLKLIRSLARAHTQNTSVRAFVSMVMEEFTMFSSFAARVCIRSME